jgi:PLAT/LH2 domain
MTILGMVVNLVTFDSEDAGTDDEIYIGLWGSAGGREFPLSSKDHEDFERGANDLYVIGVDPGFGIPLIRSDRSAPGEANDPALVPIDLNSIQYVYVRKQAYGTEEDDDAWRLGSVIVLLYDDDTLPLTGSRLFGLFAREGMWFGNEHGHQAWLSESGTDGPDLLSRLGAKAS